MAGGIWTPSSVNNAGTRPGAYINFEAAAAAAVAPGSRGVVAIAGFSTWGPDEEVVELSSEQDIIDNFQDDDDANANLYRMARQAFLGGAVRVLAFRMLGANAVKGTRTLVDTTGSPVNVIRIDAKYYGTYGNNFKLTIADDATDSDKTSIKLYDGTTLLATWTTTVDHGSSGFIDDVVSIINDDEDNIWIDAVKLADGNNDLADITSQSLASGANGDALAQSDYDAAETAFELEDFDVFACEVTTGSVQIDIKNWIEDLRDDAGKKVMAVLGAQASETVGNAITAAQNLNHEGVVFVYPGAKLPNASDVATSYSGAQLSARVAGMIAAMIAGQSLTYKEITLASDVETRLSNANIQTLIQNGVCVLVWTGSKVIVERGINSLYSVGTKPTSFAKVGVVLTCDEIANAIKESAETTFIGKVPNDEVGQLALINSVNDFLGTMVAKRAIKPGYSVVLDPDFDSTGDQVFLKITLQPIEAIEKIFSTITIG